MRMKMPYWVIAVALFLFVTTTANADNGESAKNSKDVGQGLEFSIELDSAGHGLGSTLEVTLVFRNIGASPLVLYKYRGSDSIQDLIWDIYDEQGRLVGDSRDPINWPRPPPVRKKDLITLSPGGELRIMERRFLESVGVTRAGTYILQVRYRCPLARRKVSKGTNLWSMEDGELEAQRVAFDVSP